MSVAAVPALGRGVVRAERVAAGAGRRPRQRALRAHHHRRQRRPRSDTPLPCHLACLPCLYPTTNLFCHYHTLLLIYFATTLPRQ